MSGHKSLLVSPLEPPSPSDSRDYLFSVLQGNTHASPFSPCSPGDQPPRRAGRGCLHPAPAPADARSGMQAEMPSGAAGSAHPRTRRWSWPRRALQPAREREVRDRHQGNGAEPLSSGAEISAQKSALAPAGPCTGILPLPRSRIQT